MRCPKICLHNIVLNDWGYSCLEVEMKTASPDPYKNICLWRTRFDFVEISFPEMSIPFNVSEQTQHRHLNSEDLKKKKSSNKHCSICLNVCIFLQSHQVCLVRMCKTATQLLASAEGLREINIQPSHQSSYEWQRSRHLHAFVIELVDG